MSERGVIYMAWGQNAVEQAKQSIFSLHRRAPRIPVMVVGDAACGEAFADVEKVQFHHCDVDPFADDRKKGYKFLAGRIKPLLYEISPWAWTLYVDADTYFQRSPEVGFELLKKWDIALAETQSRAIMDGIAGKDECEATAEEFGIGLLLYHNSGMIFFRKSVETKALFELWKKEWLRYQGWDEQVALKRALLRSEALYLTLPYTWNHSAVRESYMVTHWFGAGDARFDMQQRARNVARTNGELSLPMINVEISPGRYVKCREGDEEKVLAMYGNKIEDQHILNSKSLSGKEFDMTNDKGPMVKVMKRPGQYVKMYQADADAQGLKYIPEKPNKMVLPEANKGLAPSPPVEEDVQSAPHVIDPDDFTEISGVGKATNEALHDHGIHTYDDLMDAEVDFLSGSAKKAIEKWQSEL